MGNNQQYVSANGFVIINMKSLINVGGISILKTHFINLFHILPGNHYRRHKLNLTFAVSKILYLVLCFLIIIVKLVKIVKINIIIGIP